MDIKMEKEIKQLALKQYIHYFRIWFIIVAVLIVLAGVLAGVNAAGAKGIRQNNASPEERVYDYADVLTDEEEQQLREYIAKAEKKYKIDLVLVTINEDVESQGRWEQVMMNKADDFYDEKQYGYNKIHGDGALLLDNWYEDANGSQAGSWLSTCGIVEHRLGDYEIDRVLDVVYDRVEQNPYAAYKAYVDKTCQYAQEGQRQIRIPWILVLVLPIVIAVTNAIAHLHQSPAKDTTTASTYIAGGKPVMRSQRDEFSRKSVVTHRISTDSSSGSYHSGGGHHVSSGGVSHGGGGRRR